MLCLLYLLFPNTNANIDSWYYAACVKHGEQLINSHHLLFNVIGRGFFILLQFFYPQTEAIHSLYILNALSASLALFYFFKLILLLNQSKEIAMALTLFCGSCFGFFRYATDAETYIIPLTFSLIATYYYLKPKLPKNLILASFFSAMAVLTHQLHVWWSIALLIYLIRDKDIQLKNKLTFFIIQLLIPMSYLISFLYFQTDSKNFISFVVGEYEKGNASIDLSLNSVLLIIINSFRTLFQVHGNIAILFSRYPFIYTIAIVAITYVFFLFHKKNRLNLHMIRRHNPSKNRSIFFIAFLLHYIFAFLSSGNAEFMVMLPFLAVAYFACLYDFNSLRPALPITICLVIWNLSFAIIPNNQLNLIRTDYIEAFMIKHPQAFYYLKDKPLIENKICYKYGFRHPYKFISEDRVVSKLSLDNEIYTNWGNSDGPLNRAQLIVTSNKGINAELTWTKVDSFNNFYGKNYIWLISKPAENPIFAD
ncbi:MAG: hypothetical protein JNM67_05755 [Bacteroidetes bacterium]|nr:hypothetical protein [Bacteroidota bacterium]